MATCPQCGYELQEFERECPRCKHLGIRPQVYPGDEPEPRRQFTLEDPESTAPPRRTLSPPAVGAVVGSDGMMLLAVMLKVTGAVAAPWPQLLVGAALLGGVVGLLFALALQSGGKA